MNYISIDELNHFEFHDAKLQKMEFNNGSMRWELSAVNATTQNSQNSFDKDMCIKEAEIVFENAKIENIVFGAYKVYDSNQVLIESAEAKTAIPDEYDTILQNALGNYRYIYSMDELHKIDGKTYIVCFNIDGGDDDYYLTLSFTKSIVQWNEYSGEAWYEDEKWKKSRSD